jgi:hypothetical protein
VAYCFEEGSGLSTTDNSGNGHTGTLTNNPAWVAGRYGAGLRFDGNRSGHQYLSFGPDDSFDAVSQGTIMAWVKPAVTSGFRGWFQSGQDGQCQWPMELSAANGTFEFWGGGSSCNATLYAVTLIPGVPTDWHHVAYVVTATGNAFYVDGQLQAASYVQGNSATKVFFAQTATGISKYRVGATEYPPETFDGVIDEFRIYGAALTQAEIQGAMASAFCGGG